MKRIQTALISLFAVVSGFAADISYATYSTTTDNDSATTTAANNGAFRVVTAFTDGGKTAVHTTSATNDAATDNGTAYYGRTGCCSCCHSLFTLLGYVQIEVHSIRCLVERTVEG